MASSTSGSDFTNGKAEVGGRERWSSRITFVIASVGAAVGLGNLWRFPYLNYKHGGGAFLIPYFLFLLCTGIPLITLEVALGRHFQRGDVECFGKIHRRARGVGTISCIGGFGVVTYYSAIIAYAAYYFVASFQHPLPWATRDCVGTPEEIATCAADPDQVLPITSSSDYFLDTVLRYNPANVEKGTATIIAGPLYGGLLVSWIVAYFCIWKGVGSVGKAINVTVAGPWIILVILVIYNATLDGAREGVEAYIGEWNMSTLGNGAAWSDAAGQIFFSLGATLGIMTAYASYTPKNTNVFADSAIISCINCFTSVFAGFAVFSILGNMASRHVSLASENPELRENICLSSLQTGTCEIADFDCTTCYLDDWANHGPCCGYVSTTNIARSGFFLAFSVYPATMQYLNKFAGHFMCVLWFGCLYLLGIDSMFAMVEGVSTVITDTARFRHVKKETVALVTCTLGFIISVAFVTDIGLAMLDIFDHFIITYGLILTGSLEAYCGSWVWGYYETRDKIGKLSAMILTLGFTIACLVGAGIGGALHYEVDTGVNIAIGFGIGAFIFLSSIVASFVTRDNKSQSFGEFFGVWSCAGTRELRRGFVGNEREPTKSETILHIIFYDFMLKYICPPVLLGLFINIIISDATNYDKGYENYPAWLQAVAGVGVLGVMFFSLIFFFFYPGFWEKIGGSEAQQAETRRQIAEENAPADVESQKADTSYGKK